MMRRVASSTSQDNNSYAKGIKILLEIWRNYKHRLPSKLYEERMLQIADFLCGIKLYQLALWQGYGLHLQQFSSVNITDITDVDHFMACFFPEGFDTDQDILDMKALEYLVWASISLELSIPLMTAKYLPWIVTLHCAVCHCYYDNQATVQAELAAMMFKRAVFEARKRPKHMFRIKTKSTLKDIPNVPWPRNTTERMLMSLFDSSAAQFLGILEALWDSTKRPLYTRVSDEPEVQEVVLELLSAGISILSGENKVSFMSAVRFIKLLFQYKQPDAFTELAGEMLQVLSDVGDHSYRKVEMELALLVSFNSLQSSQRSRPREDSIVDDRHKSSFSMSDEFIGLVDTLHKSVCGSAPRSKTELLQKVCEMAKRGLEALAKGVATLMPQDCSSITDSAFMQKFSPIPPLTSSLPSSEEGNGEDETSEKEKEVETKAEPDVKSSRHTQSTCVSLLAADLHLELDIIHCRASLKLLQLNAVAESDLLDRIKKNKVSKALFLIQKALLVYNNMEPNKSSKTKNLLEEASTLIEKAEVEERKLYMSTTPKTPAENKDKELKEEKENSPPPPILRSRTDHSFTFVPAPYHMEEQVCWYQLCGRAAEGINWKVRLGDFSLPGTGNLVPAVSGECVLRVEGLEPNQKYVFAVAAYNSQGKLLGNSAGGTTLPLLASMPTPLLSTWAHLAQVAFQTEQYDVAKRACRELWSHYTFSDPHSSHDRLATTGLHIQTLQRSSPLLCQLFLTSIFIETEINIQQGSLYCDSSSDSGLFIWEQEARLAECERMLVAMDLAMWLNDGSAALQAVVSCYGLLAPLIFHQITCDPVVQVLTKCLTVLEENSALLKQKWTGNTSESLMHMIACITYYLSKALRVLKEPQMASAVMDCGRTLLQDVFDAQLQISRVANKAVGKQFQLRNMCSEERVWKSHLNYSMAQAHLTVLYQVLDQLHGGDLQHRYSQLNPLCFSLAYTGVLVKQRKSQQQQSSKCEVVPERDSSHSGLRDYVMAAHKDRNKKEEVRVDDSAADKREREGEDSSQSVEQQVLAHRGSHWTNLQTVCQTMWDQSYRLAILVQRADQVKPPFLLTTDQLHTTFTPLLVLSTDLIMDMLNKLGLWSLYDSDFTEEELESSLHFSASLDDSTRVDLRWVRTLVLHTLERLHDSGKWENLAHFALLFNSYTRERYALIVTPLLVHAQRRLLERISSFGGPAVPQPHHAKSQRANGKEVTYRSYAGCQLLSGWIPHTALQPLSRKKAPLTNLNPQDSTELKGAEMQHSMSLVCVPLDVEDTLCCYRQALERRPHCLQVFQHSRSLLLRLLAYTQSCFAAQRHGQSRSLSHSASLVDFSPMVMPTPNIQPRDLMEEDYSSPNALYSLPVSPDHMPTVIAAYSTSIKYLQANSHDSLRVLALHEMGNLQFYNGNTRAAHSYWSKAVDSALQNSGVVEKWDGVSFGGGTMQQTLKQAGIWGCLQAAGLTAKIAQHILTSDISQRTKYCLLSAHLFKPQADLQYASHSIGDELLPGVDLFSEPHRVHLGTTVTSLNFICHWLFITGYQITLLPMLALYQYFVGTVCRDVQRSVEGKILKIRALTELCLFTEAVNEAVQVAQGTGVRLPNGYCINQDNLQDRLESEGSCLKTEEPKVLALDSQKKKLTPGRIKFLLLEAASSLLRSISQKLTSQSCSETENLELAIESNLLKASLYLQQGHAALSSEMAVSSLVLLQASPLMVRGSIPGSEKLVSEFSHARAGSEQGTKDCSLSSPLHGDCSRAVEANERIGIALWLRCRLALFRSLAAQIPDATALTPGKNINQGATRMLQEGLDECALWGDLDIQALLMVEGAELEEQRGKTDDSMALLQ
eukprot:superscaffoldBa00003282_g16549